MSRYTYTLNPSQGVTEKHTYRQSELEKMTTFHLREICRKERLVVSSAKNDDKDGLIRLIMRFRGQRNTDISENSVKAEWNAYRSF